MTTTKTRDEIYYDTESKDEPALESGVDDISLDAWLAQDDYRTGKVRVSGGALAIASLTEDEVDQLQRACDKPNPKAGRGATRFDATAFKRLLAAKSLSKASGVPEAQILPRLNGKLAGDVTVIAEAITKLSGFDPERSSSTDELLGFSG